MLTWNEFFNFKDDDQLKDAGAQIDAFGKKYEGMVEAVVASNARLAGEFSEVSSAAITMLSDIKKLNVGIDANEDALNQTAKASEDLVKNFDALKAVEAENTKLIKTLTDEIEKLKAAKDKLKDSTKAEAGSYDDLKVKLAEAEKAYKAMGDNTSQAIKDEQLSKVRTLAAEFKGVSGALNDAKKGAIVAAGSYNELAARVAEAKKQLKAMEGGLDGNSKEFKELQKFAAEGTEQLKAFDETVGDNTRNVGGYQGAILGAVEKLKTIPGAAGAADKAMKVLSSNPIVFTLLAIGAAVGALTAYFKSSIEGQDDLNKVMRVGEAIFETLKDVVELFGKALFYAISHPKEIIKEIWDLIKQVGGAIKEAFENPIDTIKAFGNAIIENIISRVVGLGKIFTAVGKIIKSGFTDGFEDLANAGIQAITGIEDGVGKLVEAFKPLTDEMKKRLALGEQIAEVENKLRKDRIADIIDDAKTELAVTKLLVDARDKLRFSEEERFKKLREANKLLEEQLQGDLQLARDEIRLQQLIIQQDGETYEARQKLVELQAKEVELQSAFFKARKKRQAEEIALIREIEKETADARKRTADAEAALNRVRINDAIATNNRILADENSSLEDRLQAIAENDAAQLKLLEQEKEQQLAAAKEAGLARIELDADTLDAIYSQENLSIQQRIQLERDAKTELLSTDQAYLDQTIAIQEDFTNKSNELLESSKKLAKDNVFKILARDAEIASATLNKETNDQLAALNAAFAAGDVKSLQDFEDQKNEIQRKAQADSIQMQIDYLRQRASLLKEGSKERVKIEEQISALELQTTKQAADDRVQTEIALQKTLQQLKQVAFQGARDIANNLFDAAEQDRAVELQKLEENYNKQVELAGDNEEAKAKLKEEFDEKKKQIEQQQAEANRRRAIFEKALAVTEIGINTAKGIGQALGAYVPPASFIIAAAVGAMGAIQIASVLSKPIPKFAVGTEDAPGGLAYINELGPELIVDKDGKGRIINTDGPTLAYVPKHATVYTADETERMKEFDNYSNQIGVLKSGVNTIIEVSEKQNNKEVVDALNRRFTSLEQTIRSKKDVHLNVTKRGVETLVRNAESTIKFLDEFFS